MSRGASGRPGPSDAGEIDRRGPALGLLELESLARGPLVADRLLKRAEVRIVRAGAVTPGKYLLLLEGEVAEMEEAMLAAREAAGPLLIDALLLPGAADGLLAALRGRFTQGLAESLAVVETETAAATLRAADAALKNADVALTHLHLCAGIGGKGWLSLTGALHMLEAALEVAVVAAGGPGLVTSELIERPHPDLAASGVLPFPSGADI